MQERRVAKGDLVVRGTDAVEVGYAAKAAPVSVPAPASDSYPATASAPCSPSQHYSDLEHLGRDPGSGSGLAPDSGPLLERC